MNLASRSASAGVRSGAVLGGDASFGTLTDVMDKLGELNQSPQDYTTPPNFRVIVNVNQLVEMATNADTAGKKARADKEQAAAAIDGKKPALSAERCQPDASLEGTRGNRGGRRGALQAQRRERGGQIFRDTLAKATIALKSIQGSQKRELRCEFAWNRDS